MRMVTMAATIEFYYSHLPRGLLYFPSRIEGQPSSLRSRDRTVRDFVSLVSTIVAGWLFCWNGIQWFVLLRLIDIRLLLSLGDGLVLLWLGDSRLLLRLSGNVMLLKLIAVLFLGDILGLRHL